MRIDKYFDMATLGYRTSRQISAISELITWVAWEEITPEKIDGLGLVLEGYAEKVHRLAECLDTVPRSDVGREARLEQTLKDFADFLLSDPDPVDLKTMAANIRYKLDQ